MLAVPARLAGALAKRADRQAIMHEVFDERKDAEADGDGKEFRAPRVKNPRAPGASGPSLYFPILPACTFTWGKKSRGRRSAVSAASIATSAQTACMELAPNQKLSVGCIALPATKRSESTSILSAVASKNAPKSDTTRRTLASTPSSQSVQTAIAKSATAATTKP